MTRYDSVKQYLRSHQFTWLVTGVAGFIGSNLLETLLRLNQRVVGLDNFETGYQKNLEAALADSGNPDAPDLFTFIEGDIRDLETCSKACKSVDYVLHQAALGSVPRSIEDPIPTNQTNIDGFLNMLVAARDANVKRFVYAASSSTYGDHPDLPKVEDKIGNPLSPYAVTKLVNELYAGVFARTYGFNTIGLRYFNIFGKRQDPDGAYAAVIPKWVAAILKGDTVYINGDGETSRDFCYIDNAVQMNLLAATAGNIPLIPAAEGTEKSGNSNDPTNQVYNVAVGDRTDLNQLYKLIRGGLAEGHELPPEKLVYRDFRAGDVRHSLADISKAQKSLGYAPEYKIGSGIHQALQWYVSSLC